MKINHYNTYPYGGAANAARRIHDGICDQGIDSTFYYRIDDRDFASRNNDPNLVQIEYRDPGQDEKNRFRRWSPLRKRIEKRRIRQIHRLYDFHIQPRSSSEHEVYSMARLPQDTKLNWAEQQSDIVHLHWLAHMIDFPSFFGSIPDEVPIVWTMHDMGAFTGGCHYSEGCLRFDAGCGSCPQVANPNPKDVSHDSIRAKQRSLKGKRLHIVAPSNWLIELAKRSPIWPADTTFSVIHYGLDLRQFRPQDKAVARQQMGIVTDKLVVGFGADDLGNRRKGFEYLSQALSQLAGESAAKSPIELVVFGEGEISDELRSQFKTHSFGFVRDPDRLATIYACCDTVVVPSLQDNQPQVGLEAMACGRPVIGFDAGGIPEYVIDDVNGILVPVRKTAALASAITWMAENPQAVRSFGEQARQKLENDFEIKTQTLAYNNLYRCLFESSNMPFETPLGKRIA